MSSSETREAGGDGSILNHVIASYLEDADRLGDDAARQRLRDEYLAANPQLAERLKGHFDDEDVIGRTLRPVVHVEPRFARYSQLSKIGHGAMGVVYKGFDEELKRWVALKVATVDESSPGEARRIRVEAESMARLTHRNIVKVYDVRAESGSTVISMELVPDGSLEEHLGELTDNRRAIARLMVDLARAVHHAHQRGILHRDLKPANVLLAREEHGAFHPYVSDFGLAKPVDAAESHGSGPAVGAGTLAYGRIVGTASYMSPEQAAGNRATTLSDVYGLGGILYALLTGRSPFRGDTADETLAMVRDPAQRPQPPSTLNPRTDPTLEAICLTCLKKDPEQRYRSAEGVARDLDRWLAHRPTDARRLGVVGRAALWARRTPLGAGLLATLLVLGVVSGTQLADWLAAPRRARLDVAEVQLEQLRSRLRDIKGAVEDTAKNSGLAALLLDGDRPKLQTVLKEQAERYRELVGPPFASVFVIDGRDGAMVARWPTPDPESDGIDLRPRDYYRGLLASTTPGAHVSKVFRGVTDELFRFGVSARLVHRNKTVGVVVFTVTTDDRMGLPYVPNKSLVTSVLALRDPHPLPREKGPKQDNASPYVILRHPAYGSGTEPGWLPCEYLDDLARGEAGAYRDAVADLPVPAARRYQGPWVATFARDKDTGFVVVVQQRPGLLRTFFVGVVDRLRDLRAIAKRRCG